jgi:hypothetical protein
VTRTLNWAKGREQKAWRISSIWTREMRPFFQVN